MHQGRPNRASTVQIVILSLVIFATVLVALTLTACGSTAPTTTHTATEKQADTTTSAAPAWSPSRPPTRAYTEQEMQPAGAEGVLPADLAALGKRFQAGESLGKCIEEQLGINDDSHVVALLIALHSHEAAAEEAATKARAACGP